MRHEVAQEESSAKPVDVIDVIKEADTNMAFDVVVESSEEEPSET